MKEKSLRMKQCKEYNAWRNMKYRCNTKSCSAFYNYGARGITVCARWQESFENFFEDMGVCPSEYSIDRIDNNGNYGPNNCRWASRKTQANNKRRIGDFNVMERFEMKIKETYGENYDENFIKPDNCLSVREIMASKKKSKTD